MQIIAIEPSGESSRVYLAGNPSLTDAEHSEALISSSKLNHTGGINEGGLWEYSRPYSNGNKQRSITFTTRMQFATERDAMVWDMNFDSWMPTEGIIIMMIRTADGTAWEIWRSARPGTVEHGGTTHLAIERIVTYTVTVGLMRAAGNILMEDGTPLTDESGATIQTE